MCNVKNQKMWQQAFHRKMLDNIVGPDIKTKEFSETDKSTEIKENILDIKNNPSTSKDSKQIKEEQKDLIDKKEKKEPNLNNELKKKLKDESTSCVRESNKESKGNRTEKLSSKNLLKYIINWFCFFVKNLF